MAKKDEEKHLNSATEGAFTWLLVRSTSERLVVRANVCTLFADGLVKGVAIWKEATDSQQESWERLATE